MLGVLGPRRRRGCSGVMRAVSPKDAQTPSGSSAISDSCKQTLCRHVLSEESTFWVLIHSETSRHIGWTRSRSVLCRGGCADLQSAGVSPEGRYDIMDMQGAQVRRCPPGGGCGGQVQVNDWSVW